MSTYKTLVLAKRPTGTIVPGDAFLTKEDNVAPAEAELKEGEVLVETPLLERRSRSASVARPMLAHTRNLSRLARS